MRILTSAVASVAVAIFVSCASDADRASPEPDPSADGSASPPPQADAGPSDVSTSPPKPVAVSCEEDPCYLAVSGSGGRHMCGLLRDGTVRCWGRNTWNPATTSDGGEPLDDGALGRGAPISSVEGATPAPVVGLSGVTQLSVGPNLGSCARTADGAVYCWGRNEFGQLGHPETEASLTVPTRVAGIPAVDQVKLGYGTGCAVGSADGALYCWGKSLEGDRPSYPPQPAPILPPHLEPEFRPPVKALAIGTWNSVDTFVTLIEGDVLAVKGGHLPKGDSVFPSTGLIRKSNVTNVAAFGYIAKDDRFRRWAPREETLYVAATAPIVDAKISGETKESMSIQGGVLTATGRLFRWGPNVAGGLGRDPSAMMNATYPVEISNLDKQVVSFATTVRSTCASLTDGKIKCWGANAFGELGRGTVDFDAHPEAEVIR